MDRQWSNKLECYVAQARRVVMAYGSAGAHREELKEKQLPLLRLQYLTQVRVRSIILVPTAKTRTTRLIQLGKCPLRTNPISGLMVTLQHRSRRCDAVATSPPRTQI